MFRLVPSATEAGLTDRGQAQARRAGRGGLGRRGGLGSGAAEGGGGGARGLRRGAPGGGRRGRRTPFRFVRRRFGRQNFQAHLPKRAQAAVVGGRQLEDVGRRRRIRRRRNRNLQKGMGAEGRGPASPPQPSRRPLAGLQMQGGQQLHDLRIRIRRVGRQHQAAARTHRAAQSLQGRGRVGGKEGGNFGRRRGRGFEGGGRCIVHRADGGGEGQAQNGQPENEPGPDARFGHCPLPAFMRRLQKS